MKKELIRDLKDYEFVAWETTNGHRHTCKAYDEFTPWFGGNVEDDICNQLEYLAYVEGRENTNLADWDTAQSEEEALEKDIIYIEGDEIHIY